MNTHVNTNVNALLNIQVNTQVSAHVNTQVNTQVNNQVNTAANAHVNTQATTQVNTLVTPSLSPKPPYHTKGGLIGIYTHTHLYSCICLFLYNFIMHNEVVDQSWYATSLCIMKS